MLSVAFMQSELYSAPAVNAPICEDLPDLDAPQPYPIIGWNEFDLGNDNGLEADGELSFTLISMVDRNNVAIGLDKDPQAATHYGTIDFAFYFIHNSTGSNIVRVYENGVNQGTLVSTPNSIDGYTFSIKRTNGVVEYYMNDVLEFTSTINSTSHLYYDNACKQKTAVSVFEARQIKLCVPGPPDASTIKVNSAYVNNKVRLRWMTTDMTMWEHAMKVGYTIERITVAVNGTYLSKNERAASYVVLASGYLPKSQTEMEAATSNPNEGTLAHQLMGDQNTEDSIMGVGAGEQSLAKAVQQKKMRDMRYFASHVLAEKSFEMACAMGMAYEDDTIDPNKQYAYIITLTEPLN